MPKYHIGDVVRIKYGEYKDYCLMVKSSKREDEHFIYELEAGWYKEDDLDHAD